MKVAIIGAGAAGLSCATALVIRGCAREIVIIDRTPARAIGLATDVRYGATLSPGVNGRSGDYSDLKGAALAVITDGVNEKTGGATDRNDPAGCLRLFDTKGRRLRGRCRPDPSPPSTGFPGPRRGSRAASCV
jgi:L-lactate dehydrogenase